MSRPGIIAKLEKPKILSGKVNNYCVRGGNSTDSEGSEDFKRVVSGRAIFGVDGQPASLIDDNGNSVSFTSGYPTSATDSDGNTVPILWG